MARRALDRLEEALAARKDEKLRAALEPLLKDLKGRDTAKRVKALEMLAGLGPDAKPAAEAVAGRSPMGLFLRNYFKNPSGGSCSRSSPVGGNGKPDASPAVPRNGSSGVEPGPPRRARSPRCSGSDPSRCRGASAAAPGGL